MLTKSISPWSMHLTGHQIGTVQNGHRIHWNPIMTSTKQLRHNNTICHPARTLAANRSFLLTPQFQNEHNMPLFCLFFHSLYYNMLGSISHFSLLPQLTYPKQCQMMMWHQRLHPFTFKLDPYNSKMANPTKVKGVRS